MSTLGISEMRRWEQQARALFPWLPTVVITDDGVTPNTAVTSVLPDGTIKIALWVDMVPGRAVGWHEMCHAIQRTIQFRIDNMLGLVREAFVIRGFPPFADDYLYFTFEQMASMLPEAFIGEWGGYNHPLYGLTPAAQSLAWFNSPASQAVRDWFLRLDTWEGSVATDYPGAAWVASPNYNLRPNGVAISATVEHWTTSSAASTIATFQTAGGSNPVSAHYMVARDGAIYQFVREANRAWHDSSADWNDKSIGIEHEHIPGQDWPIVQLEASQRLHQDIYARHGVIPAFGHGATYSVFTTECPGDLPIYLLTEEDDLFTQADRDKLNRVYDMANAEGPRIWTQRLQDWLSKALKSMPTYAKPTDYTGPDVTTNLPRT